ncbi:MAG: aldolase [Burkholderiaceae bacterium]
MNEFESVRHEICRVGRSLFERGYVHATAGNISVRLPDGEGFLITPTDACLGVLEPGQLAHVDAAGEPRGAARASKTLALHQGIYGAAPQAQWVLHTHSTHLVALALGGVWSAASVLPPITPYFVMKVGQVPLVRYHRPGDPAVIGTVVALIETARARGATLRAVMLDRLGPIVWHDSAAAAMAALEELEETARLWLLTQRRPAPLSQAQLDELQDAFGATW